jgi:23S rRNA (uracil1939-C5)-methyltransferase
VARLLPGLRALVGSLSLADRLPQIEVAVGDRVVVLVLRILQPLAADDEDALRCYADAHGVQIWLQPGGPDSAVVFHPMDLPPLTYRLPDYDVEIGFRPTDFTQVNHAMNRMLVRRAMQLLDPRAGESIADLFCGLGNFTLPIARSGARVLGIEGSAGLVQRARDNALANGLADRTAFRVANLFDPATASPGSPCDKMLIDPPREGAAEVVKALGGDAPRRIVYVSCNPGTLARDAAILTQTRGYVLAGAGIANMFPHTSHVESIALFERR